MIKIYLKYDNMHTFRVINAFICINNHVNSCINSMLSITRLGVVPKILDPILLFCDNNGAIAQAKEPSSHQKSKHIFRRFHLTREIISRRDIVVERVPSTDNITHPLTKPLAQEVFLAPLHNYGFDGQR